MRNWTKWSAVAAVCLALVVSPALAKKKQIERRSIDGFTLAEIRPNTQISPYYPATARTTKAESTVTLSMQVRPDGRVGEIEVLNSTAIGLGFEQSASDAVRTWRFHPALQDGEPVESVTMVHLTFAPPSLRMPDGFVFTEANPIPFGATSIGGLRNRLEGSGFFTQSHEERARLVRAEVPSCALRGGGGCIYNRDDLLQFQGQSGLRHAPGSGVVGNTGGTNSVGTR